jgi:divinyl protochlorophyllide a 8-vinyl-reductase
VPEILATARVDPPAADSGITPRGQTLAVFATVAARHPSEATPILRAAGRGTADYILASRIPPAAQRLPGGAAGGLGARLLAMAIARHASIFCRLRALRDFQAAFACS